MPAPNDLPFQAQQTSRTQQTSRPKAARPQRPPSRPSLRHFGRPDRTGHGEPAILEGGLVERIVVPVGGSDREFLAQHQAVEYAAALGVPVVAVHVTLAPEAVRPDLFAYLATTCGRWGVPLELQILAQPDVPEALLSMLDPQDLVVIGTTRLGTGRPSHALRIVQAAPCPVQILRL